MLSVIQLLDILSNRRSTDASMALHVHVVSESEHDRLDLGGQLSSRGEDESLGFSDVGVDGLEDGDGEGRGFTGSGLSLSDDVSTFGDGENGSLLDGGGLLKVWEERKGGMEGKRSDPSSRARSSLSPAEGLRKTHCRRRYLGGGLP